MRSFRIFHTGAVALGALVIGSLLGAGTAGAQATDPRWHPWLGCWNAGDARTSSSGGATDGMVCFVPASGGPGVDVVVIDQGKVSHRDGLNPTGQRAPKTVENCPGWESAVWSVDDRRLLSRMEYTCGKITMKGSNIFAMSSEGDWIEVRGTIVGANSTVRVVRYSPTGVALAQATGAARSDSMPYVIVPQKGVNSRYSRLAIGEPVDPDAVLDVVEHVDLPVAEAWLNELGQGFTLDARQLVHLADAGMPPKVIDLMVALSYPKQFAVRRAAPDRTMTGAGAGAFDYGPSQRYGNALDCGYGYLPTMYGFNLGDCYWGYSRYGYGYGQRYGYGSGYGYPGYGYPGYGSPGYGYGGYYWGQTPIVIVPAGPAASPQPRGQAVNGAGYTRRPGGGDGSGEAVRPRAPVREPGSSVGSPSQSGGSNPSTSAGASAGSSSGGDDGRTAKPRVPPG